LPRFRTRYARRGEPGRGLLRAMSEEGRRGRRLTPGERSGQEDVAVAGHDGRLGPVSNPMATDPRDFSVVLGGPLYQLFRKAHLTGDALELVRQRLLLIVALSWLPLLVLCLLERSEEHTSELQSRAQI